MKFNIIDVRSGMVTITPVIKKGKVLVDAGVVLTHEIIQNLKRNNVLSVDVVVGTGTQTLQENVTDITETELTKIGQSIVETEHKETKINQAEVTNLVDKVSGIVTFDIDTVSKSETYKEFINDYSTKLDNFSDNINSFLENQDAIEPQVFINDIKEMIQPTKFSASDIINSILCMSDLDNSTYAHSMNVAMISYVIGSWLKLDEKQLETLLLGGMLHDIGKIDLNQDILLKQGKLTDEEFEHIKQHPVIGWRKVQNNSSLSEDVKMCILQHHEKNDGSGYPLHFKEPRINYYAKIITIADVYEAMTADRCYRKGMTPLKAASIIQADSYSKYDMNIAMVFLNKIIQTYIGETAILSNDHYAHIIKIDEKDLLNPIVQDLETNQVIDLKHSDLEIKKLM